MTVDSHDSSASAHEHLLARLERLEREMEAVRRDNSQLRARLAAADAPVGGGAAPPMGSGVTRRTLLMGGAAAVGSGLVVAASALRPRPAGADPGDSGWGADSAGVGGTDSGDAITLGEINIADPNQATSIRGDSENSFVFGVDNVSDSFLIQGNNRVAVFGVSSSATNARGVYGNAPGAGAGNFGVYGQARSKTGLAGQNAGVCGESKESIGVIGLSTNDTAVFGFNNGTGFALFGYQTGTERAVLGRIDNVNSTATAVHGTTNGKGDGVFGESKPTFTGDPGNGVRGVAVGSGSGVVGENNSTGFAVLGYQNGTGRAVLGRVDNPNSGAAAVHGTTNGNGDGVFGEITKTTSGSPGVHGATAGTGNGVFGEVTNTGSGANAVLGIANGSGNSVYGYKPPGTGGDAVVGWSRSGIGVFGLSDTGFGIRAQGGRAPLLLIPRGVPGAPTDSAHEKGEVMTDSDGAVWICTRGPLNSDGPVWRKLAAGARNFGAVSGTVNYLASPIRIFDTRNNKGGAGTTKMTNGEARDITVSPATVGSISIPSGAVAVLGNLGVTGTSGGGYLTMYPKGSPPPGGGETASINWFAANQSLNNGITVRIDPATGKCTIKNGIVGGSSATHVIFDATAFVM